MGIKHRSPLYISDGDTRYILDEMLSSFLIRAIKYHLKQLSTLQTISQTLNEERLQNITKRIEKLKDTIFMLTNELANHDPTKDIEPYALKNYNLPSTFKKWDEIKDTTIPQGYPHKWNEVINPNIDTDTES
jgi:hypothetical protein